MCVCPFVSEKFLTLLYFYYNWTEILQLNKDAENFQLKKGFQNKLLYTDGKYNPVINYSILLIPVDTILQV